MQICTHLIAQWTGKFLTVTLKQNQVNKNLYFNWYFVKITANNEIFYRFKFPSENIFNDVSYFSLNNIFFCCLLVLVFVYFGLIFFLNILLRGTAGVRGEYGGTGSWVELRFRMWNFQDSIKKVMIKDVQSCYKYKNINIVKYI